MSAPPVRQRGFLISLAAEGMAALIPRCAAGPIGQGDTHAIDVFGPAIVHRWVEWMRGQPPGLRSAAVSELADLPATRARAEAVSVVDRLAPDATVEDRALAVEYLCALPRSCQPSLVLDPMSGGRILPAGQQLDDPAVLLRLLPIDVPPLVPGSVLPGTPYQLGDLSGTVLGVVYRASLEGKPLLVRFPVLRSLIAAMREQRPLLEQVREAGRGTWNDRLVRLLDFNLDHATPFLVHEPVPGGDLAVLLTNLREQAHRGFTPDEVFRIVEQLVEGLAFLQERGLVHGDIKPANIIVSGEAVKLAGLGTGIAVSSHALAHSRVGTAATDQLTPADRVGLARGAASLLYLSPERIAGRPAEPNDDLYSLGVLWYQLLASDLTRPVEEEHLQQVLTRSDVPQSHRVVIARCLARKEERLPDAVALLTELRPGVRRVLTDEEHAASIVSPEEVRQERQRKRELLSSLRVLRERLHRWQEQHLKVRKLSGGDVILTLVFLPFLILPFFSPWANVPVDTIVLCTVLALVLVSRWRKRSSRSQNMFSDLQRMVSRLNEANPDEVQAWGGEAALLNRSLLQEIIAALEEDMRALAIEQEETAE